MLKDATEAVKWYRKAAEQGLAQAQSNLGQHYLVGEGVAKDAVEAATWYCKAAEQGDKNGQYNLGHCYRTGVGVAKDYVEAYKWFSLASAQGDEDARKAKLFTGQQMTPEQIAAASRLVLQFKPRSTPEKEAPPVEEPPKP